MPAILFGSISTVADTSELQREAFNKAFQQHGLSWKWDRNDYRDLLDQGAGGAKRVAEFAAARGEDVDAAAVHLTKTELFQASIAGSGLTPRPGVVETIAAAKDKGQKVGLVTTTAAESVTSLLDALPGVEIADFDVIVDSSKVEEPKPDKASYAYALGELGEQAADCVAVEDNPDGVRAADAAGVAVVAYPNQNTAGRDFGPARSTVDVLDPAALQQLLEG